MATKSLIEEVYLAGYEDRQKERDYDPLGSQAVDEALKQFNSRIKETLEEGFSTYREAYRHNENDVGKLYPRDTFKDLNSYLAAEVEKLLQAKTT